MRDCETKARENNFFCEEVNRTIPPSFCKAVCRGENQERWRRGDDVAVERKKLLASVPLTQEQRDNKDMVSVLLPCVEYDKQYLSRTIDALRKTAIGPIEIIVLYDGWEGRLGDLPLVFSEKVGLRVAFNKGVKYAKGKYLFKIDAHCNMSPAWDARMKISCGSTSMVTCMFDKLNVETWDGEGRYVGFTKLDKDFRFKFVRHWKPHLEVQEETMTTIGCAVMIQKEYYESLGGCDEKLGGYGFLGPEWSLKIWLTGGCVFFRTDVICCHLFRTESCVPYEFANDQRTKAADILQKQWVDGGDGRAIYPMEWLVEKFKSG